MRGWGGLVGLALLVGACSPDGGPTATPTTAHLTASPIPTRTRPQPTPTFTRTRSGEPSETRSPPRDEPTDSDRARFVRQYRRAGTSDLQHVVANADRDEAAEIVFAYVVDAERRSQAEIADWSGTEYAIVSRAPGGGADAIGDVRVDDVNRDGRVDLAVFQTVGAVGSSMSLWTIAGGPQLEALDGVGGCADGRNTFGDGGVELRDTDGDGAAEIRAVCEDAQLPRPLWPTAVYRWSRGAYRCDHLESPDGARSRCV